MFRIHNKYGKADICLPRNIVIPRNGSITMHDAEWLFMARHSVVSTWLETGVITEEHFDETAAPIEPTPDAPSVLAMADSVPFPTFKAEARKLLGDATPSTKIEIVAALEALNKPASNGWN